MKEIKVSLARKTIAKTLTESLQIPFASCQVRVRVGDLLERSSAYKYKIDACLLWAIAKAVKIVPEANVKWVERQDGAVIEQYENVNIGFAVESSSGLVVLPLLEVDKKTIADIDIAVKEFSARAKIPRGLKPGDFVLKPNFALNNVGAYKNIIDGEPIPQPWNTIMVSAFRAENIGYSWYASPVYIMNLKITFDHRPFDGSVAAKFANALKDQLENPRF